MVRDLSLSLHEVCEVRDAVHQCTEVLMGYGTTYLRVSMDETVRFVLFHANLWPSVVCAMRLGTKCMTGALRRHPWQASCVAVHGAACFRVG